MRGNCAKFEFSFTVGRQIHSFVSTTQTTIDGLYMDNVRYRLSPVTKRRITQGHKSMTACVRILSTASVDSSPAILLVSADGSKILVNCGEGCQRSFLEYSQRLSTVTTVCLTHLGHEAIGGLPGAILTSADGAAAADAHAILVQQKQKQQQPQANGRQGEEPQSLPGLQVVGPVGTKHYIRALRHFMRREKFLVDIHEGVVVNLQPTKQPNNRKRGIHRNSKDDAPEQVGFTIQSLAFSENASGSPHTNGSRKRPYSVNDAMDTNNTCQQVLSFIIQTSLIPGKFLRDKAAELGVPKGPLYGKLKSGQTVTFVDDAGLERTVESWQVVTPSSPAVAVMFLYYPTVGVARQLFSSEKLKAVIDSDEVCVELVIHIASHDLFHEFGLPSWKKKDIEHVFLSTDRKDGDVDGTLFQSAGRGARARSLLCPQIYQVPRPPSNPQQLSRVTGYKVGRAMMEYTLIPRSKRGFSDSVELYNRNSEDQEADRLVESTGALAVAQEAINDFAIVDAVESTGELIFTGTGSAMPCKHRNVTGMLLKQADGRSILLDVGEGTIGQLLRAQPAAKYDDILDSINAVWISHPHADHHLGLLRLLKDRRSTEPILLIAPTPLFVFLEEYSVAIDCSIRQSYYAIDCKYLINDNRELRTRLQRDLGISNCRVVPVSHCAHAYAVILDGTSFGRVVYSGDCRPSAQLAKAAKGADLLIHEATFEDGMEAEAALKKHSTVGEALGVGREMETKCTILTHFSQRYPKIPPTPAKEYFFPIIFAFDYMRLQPRTLLVASKLTPALRLLFPEGGGEDDEVVVDSTAAEAMLVPGVFAMSNLL